MIIDGHAHISNSDVGNVDKYIEQLKATGIEAGVTVPGGTLDVRRMTDYIIGRAQPSTEPPVSIVSTPMKVVWRRSWPMHLPLVLEA